MLFTQLIFIAIHTALALNAPWWLLLSIPIHCGQVLALMNDIENNS